MRIWLGSSTKRTSFKYFEKKINPSSDPSILNGNVHLLGYREKMPSTCIFSHLSLIYSFSSSPPFSSSLPFNFLYFLSCIVSHFFPILSYFSTFLPTNTDWLSSPELGTRNTMMNKTQLHELDGGIRYTKNKIWHRAQSLLCSLSLRPYIPYLQGAMLYPPSLQSLKILSLY